MTTNPVEADGVVKRAWQAIYVGMEGCITTAVDAFLEKYSRFIARYPEAELNEIDAQMVFDSFTKQRSLQVR